MWIGVVLLVSILVAVLRGGRIANLTEIHARGWWLLLVGFGLQVGTAFLPTDQRTLAVGILLSSYVLLLLVTWLNRREAGMWIAGFGILMNFVVIAVNQGMPVLPAAVEIAGGSGELVLGAKHVVLDGSSRLPFLADVIPLPGQVVSLGDVFLAIGLGVFLEEQLHQPLRLFRHRVQGVPGSAVER